MMKRMPALELDRGGARRPGEYRPRRGARARHPGRQCARRTPQRSPIGAIIAETRLIARGHDALRKGVWRGDLYRADLVGRELMQMNVGVIGYGHIGTKVVRLLKAFGSRVLVADPYVDLGRGRKRRRPARDPRDFVERKRPSTTRTRVTAETIGFIGRAEFTAMRKGAVFINTARGPMVDYDALTQALKVRPSARGGARDLRDRARSGRPRTAAARQRDLDAPHRRRLAENHRTRRRSGRGRGAPLSRGNPAQPLRLIRRGRGGGAPATKSRRSSAVGERVSSGGGSCTP